MEKSQQIFNKLLHHPDLNHLAAQLAKSSYELEDRGLITMADRLATLRLSAWQIEKGLNKLKDGDVINGVELLNGALNLIRYRYEYQMS